MTPLVCAMEMVEYLKNVFKEHIQEEGAKSKDILIKDGFLPRVTTEEEKKKTAPAIIVTPVLITTPKPTLDEDSTVKLEINVITYSKDKMEGHRELFHILEKIRMAILKKQILANKFSLSSNHDIKETIPSESIIKSSISLKINCFMADHFVGLLKISFNMMKYFPICDK